MIGVTVVFRFKKSVPVSYDWQGFIYFYSRLYEQLPAKQKDKIMEICIEAGQEYHRALFVFVTTGLSATAVCDRYFISRSTLERVVRRYYQLSAERIFKRREKSRRL